jgi:hypothetical protein
MKPAPGPHTLRMGPQNSGPHDQGHNPLRLSRSSTAGDLDAASEEGH